MTFFQQHPRDIFPFSLGDCEMIVLDKECVLQTGPKNHAPVRISSVASASFTFTALPGHFDYNLKVPDGAWIRFEIFRREGAIYLTQKARALLENPVEDFLFPTVAYFVWAQQAENLRRIVNPAYPGEPMPEP